VGQVAAFRRQGMGGSGRATACASARSHGHNGEPAQGGGGAVIDSLEPPIGPCLLLPTCSEKVSFRMVGMVLVLSRHVARVSAPHCSTCRGLLLEMETGAHYL
jgi:hypothetical protein